MIVPFFFFYLGGIVEHHCLNFLFIIGIDIFYGSSSISITF